MLRDKRLRLALMVTVFTLFAVFLTDGARVEAGESVPALNYTILGSSELNTPETQTVVVSIGDLDKSRFTGMQPFLLWILLTAPGKAAMS